jgi:hypothetical protein
MGMSPLSPLPVDLMNAIPPDAAGTRPRKQVFICHASEDSATAQRICDLLEKRGLACWISPRDVRPGRDYAEEILLAIDQAQVVVLVLSEHANTSRFVKSEIEKAFSRGKALFPVRIREVPASKSLELFVSTSQWVDALTPPIDAAIHRMAASILELVHGADAAALESSEPPESPSRRPARQRLYQGLVVALAAVVLLILLYGAGAFVSRKKAPPAPAPSLPQVAPPSPSKPPASSAAVGNGVRAPRVAQSSPAGPLAPANRLRPSAPSPTASLVKNASPLRSVPPTLLSEDWEQYPTGEFPAASGWLLGKAYQQERYPNNHIVDSTRPGGGKCLMVSNPTGGWGMEVRREINWDPAGIAVLRAEFKWMYPATGSHSEGNNVSFVLSGPGEQSILCVQMGTRKEAPGTKLGIWTDDAVTKQLVVAADAADYGEWVAMKIEIDLENHVYAVWHNDVQLGSGLPTRSHAYSPLLIDCAKGFLQAGPGFYDDIVITALRKGERSTAAKTASPGRR